MSSTCVHTIPNLVVSSTETLHKCNEEMFFVSVCEGPTGPCLFTFPGRAQFYVSELKFSWILDTFQNTISLSYCFEVKNLFRCVFNSRFLWIIFSWIGRFLKKKIYISSGDVITLFAYRSDFGTFVRSPFSYYTKIWYLLLCVHVPLFECHSVL